MKDAEAMSAKEYAKAQYIARAVLRRDLMDPLWPGLTESDWALDARMIARALLHADALIDRSSELAAEVYREHMAVERWSLRAERFEAALQAASQRLGELTQPPFIPGYTHLVAEVRDDIRAALGSETSDGIPVDPDEPSDGRDLRGGLLP